MTQYEFGSMASDLPGLPGVYRYYDAEGIIIYVGKAKHLKKRISSYFNSSPKNNKTLELVKRISRIEYTIVDTEEDAFFLENNLIKEYQPFYNINLKDDKTYPYVVVTNEPYPRVFFTRRLRENDGSKYFGPFTSVEHVQEMLVFIKKQFPLRNCNLNLSEKNIQKKKFKVCLEYHLGNCKGPCEGLQTKEDYDTGIKKLSELLKGKLSPLLLELKEKVAFHAEQMEYEMAAVYQDKINAIEKYRKRSSVANIQTGTLDVFYFVEGKLNNYVHYLSTHEGNVIHTQTMIVENKLELDIEQQFIYAIAQLRSTYQSDAKEIVVAQPINYPEKNIVVTIPQTGDKRKLLELAQKNVIHFKWTYESRQNKQHHKDEGFSMKMVLERLQEDLQLTSLPTHIECFDNSNIQGAHPVAAMVCFKNGVPSKNDYRKFHIKTVEGINDFASMKEIVYRRYRALVDEGITLPQLVIIDGGKGQLSAAMESVTELGLNGRMTLVGLAKNKEEIFFAEDRQSKMLEWEHSGLKLIRRIRDEVHRFGISFHRDKRSKAALKNELEDIKGIGEAIATKLLQKYKSIKKLKEITFEEMSEHIGKAKALLVFEHLHKKENPAD